MLSQRSLAFGDSFPDKPFSNEQPGFFSGKTYPHSLGLSITLRQPFADSHCKLIHGYALQVELLFEAINLDRNNWVVDFGSLKSVKGILEDNFDHKTVISENDPDMDWFKEGERRGTCELIIFPHVGMEMFAYYIYGAVETWLDSNDLDSRVRVRHVKVSEHPGNVAGYGIL